MINHKLKQILDIHLISKSSIEGLKAHPDPLWVASSLREPIGALICALFAYGNAKLIVKFLYSLNFEILNESEAQINQYFELNQRKYRFENNEDVKQIFITLSRLKSNYDVESLIFEGLKNYESIEFGISNLIKTIYNINKYRSDGYEFFFGKVFDQRPTSPLKRYNMYLRWMVRNKDIDLGLFSKISPSNLLIPLDVHTHRVSQMLGLCSRKSYDFKAVLELSNNLREFDCDDPIKYDFALYRIGQANELDSVLSQLKA